MTQNRALTQACPLPNFGSTLSYIFGSVQLSVCGLWIFFARADDVSCAICETAAGDRAAQGPGLALSELFRVDLDNDSKEEITRLDLLYATRGTLLAGNGVAKPDHQGILQQVAIAAPDERGGAEELVSGGTVDRQLRGRGGI